MRKYMRLTDDDRKLLLNIARQTIVSAINNVDYVPESDSKILQVHLGAFVSLHIENRLRGCVGYFNPDKEAFKVVKDAAFSAAFQDNRFSPLAQEDLDRCVIEISILTPFEKIRDISEIELGKHGIYIMKGGRSGTFLPQVATETGWTLEEFLGHCAQDKMGLRWNDWKDADIFTYEAEVFSENEYKNN